MAGQLHEKDSDMVAGPKIRRDLRRSLKIECVKEDISMEQYINRVLAYEFGREDLIAQIMLGASADPVAAD